MEKDLKIQLSQRFSLYGKFSGSFRQPLFIMVHGLLGSMDEEFYVRATRWFGKQGFATFRFNLYGPQKNARQLMDCTLTTHSSDLDTVVCYFRKRGIKKIFVAGHSFGGLTILNSSQQNFDGAALWDPSYKISFTKRVRDFPGGRYIRAINGYLMPWGINVIIGKAMADEIDLLSWNRLGKNFKVPLRILVAGKDALKGAKNYARTGLPTMQSVVTIPGATHYFDDRAGMREKVFEISNRWFQIFHARALFFGIPKRR